MDIRGVAQPPPTLGAGLGSGKTDEGRTGVISEAGLGIGTRIGVVGPRGPVLWAGTRVVLKLNSLGLSGTGSGSS